MIVGVPKEIKEGELRVSLLAAGVRQLTTGGHEVRIETGAGRAAGLEDADYATAVAQNRRYTPADEVIKMFDLPPA